jgi:hypothetical protein
MLSRWHVGSSTLDAVPECLRAWFLDFFGRATLRRGHHPAQFEYECSGPAIQRRFLMTAYSIGGSARSGILVVNSIQVEAPQPPGAREMPAQLSRYVDKAGLVHQCSHCRRIRTVEDARVWHWVPEWVRRGPANVSHGLCAPCLYHFYPPNLEVCADAPAEMGSG